MADPKILLLGPPGAGKGTQSANLVEEYGVEHVTTGDALRANRDMETEYGTPREYMDAGELVPDPVVNEIVQAALEDAVGTSSDEPSLADAREEADGFVLDGYPRNVDQAEYLADITDLDVVAYLEVSNEELLDRLTGRRVCEDCGANFHVKYAPPAEEGICDECGGKLIQRDDDTEETARERLRVFEENTLPVVEFYDERGDLARIDGEQSPDEVWADLRSAVEDAL